MTVLWQTGARKIAPWLWFILGLGAVLRLATLNRQSLWLDEGFSYWIARRPWMDLIAYLPAHDIHPPLYYLVLQPMIALGGSEWLLRLPSALAGIASIGLLYLLGVELFDRRTGLLAALVLAVSPLHIWYAQEARMYALVAALTLASGLFAVRALRTNRLIDWTLMAICQALALWTNTAAIWFTLALNTAALLTAAPLWRSRRFWPWVGAQALATALYLPWLPALLQQMQAEPTWIPPATLTILTRTLADFVGSHERPRAEAGLALLLLVTILAAGARGLRREAWARRMDYNIPTRVGKGGVREAPTEKPTHFPNDLGLLYIWLGCWLIVPVGLAFLISQPYVRVPLLSLIFEPGRSVFLARNLIVATFPLYLLLARSLALAKRPVLAVALAALVTLNSVAYLGNALPERKEDYRAAALIVADHAMPNDLIVFAPSYLELPFAYYHNNQGSTAVPLDELEDGVIAEDQHQIYDSPAVALGNYRRVWLISTSSNVYRQDTLGTIAAVETRYRLLRSWQVEEVTVRFYERRV